MVRPPVPADVELTPPGNAAEYAAAHGITAAAAGAIALAVGPRVDAAHAHNTVEGVTDADFETSKFAIMHDARLCDVNLPAPRIREMARFVAATGCGNIRDAAATFGSAQEAMVITHLYPTGAPQGAMVRRSILGGQELTCLLQWAKFYKQEEAITQRNETQLRRGGQRPARPVDLEASIVRHGLECYRGETRLTRDDADRAQKARETKYATSPI